MDEKKKKIIFFASGGGLVLILLIILLTVVLTNGKGGTDSSDAGVSGQETSVTGGSTTKTNMSSQAAGSGTVSGGSPVAASDAQSAGSGSQAGEPNNQSNAQSVADNSSSNTSAAESPGQDENTYSILADPGFQNGFKVLGMSTADGGNAGSTIFNPLDSSGRQYWTIAQWGSRYRFADDCVTNDLGNGVFQYVNTTKEFTVDTNNAILTFTGITSKCYDTPRTGSEPWLHLLIQQSFKTSETRITDLSSVMVTLSNRLVKFEDHLGSAFNPNVHAAQFVFYFSVANKDNTSSYIWFGIPVFDNRYEWMDPSSMFDKGTSSLMVGIGNKVLYQASGTNYIWKDGTIKASPDAEWSTFKVDMLPLIINALDTAHSNGYLTNTSVDQLVITGMNMGWEIPGTYDVSMQIKDFSVMATKK